MEYTDEELDALNEEYLSEQGQQDYVVRGNPNTFQKVSLDDLKFDDNEDAFNEVKDLIASKSVLTLELYLQ